MSTVIHLAINGESRKFENICTLKQVLAASGYVAADGSLSGNIVVALNQVIIPASQYSETVLAEHDRLDILGAITGG